ncbi:EF-P 5-aminopentanol modification-associated protein YfmH [Chungangia koreensis]|uniref:EF-P 5-aminopentanol modification-associated protein YfmH n=1 Tax=Chungangia koreensis TaxID=752657 RepID=A0ABV8X102_9LACT
MEELHFQQLDETLYHEKLDNGLSVYILPKKGFSKTYVTFTTKYGSIDRSFVPIGKTEPVTVPDGIAHFLEHKMFEKEEGDVFQQFSQYGASANAYTSFTRTAYLFSATKNLYENTETLLNFVQEPYFTEKTVEKEKGIIGQEITMYDDNPDWRLYYGVIENMFKEHPVKIDIAGTIESIDKITADHLYECYRTFYHPSNMLLFIVGAVDPNEMLDFVKKNQSNKQFAEPESIERIFPQEPKEAATDRRTLQMDVQKPKMFVGLKAAQTDLSGNDMLKNELSIQLTLDLLFNRSSDFYTEAYEKGWIDESFAYDFTLENGFGFAIVGSDTSHPEELEQAIKKTFNKAFEKWPFGADELNRARRKRIGQFLRSLNSLEFMANQFTRYAFNEMDLFEVVPTLENLTVADLQEAFKSISGEGQQTVFTILPSGMKENG